MRGASIRARRDGRSRSACRKRPTIAVVRPRRQIASGADQTGVRLYNERLMLSLVRRFGQLSKIEVARHDRPFRAIDLGDHEPAAGGRPAAARGAAARAGRPADGSRFARSRGRLFARTEDRTAQLRSRADRFLRARPPARASNLRLSDARDLVWTSSSARCPRSMATLTPAQRRRIAGLGIAAPFQLWNWSAEIGAPPGAMDGWRSFRLERGNRRALCPYPRHALQRRDLGLRGGILLRRGLAASRFPVFLPRRVPRRRPCPGRRALHRPHRQRRARSARCRSPRARAAATRLRN